MIPGLTPLKKCMGNIALNFTCLNASFQGYLINSSRLLICYSWESAINNYFCITVKHTLQMVIIAFNVAKGSR